MTLQLDQQGTLAAPAGEGRGQGGEQHIVDPGPIDGGEASEQGSGLAAIEGDGDPFGRTSGVAIGRCRQVGRQTSGAAGGGKPEVAL